MALLNVYTAAVKVTLYAKQGRGLKHKGLGVPTAVWGVSSQAWFRPLFENVT